MARVHDALPALRLGGLVLGAYHECLVVAEQEQIAPFLEKRGRLTGEFHLPAVIGSHLIRQFKFPHLGVSRHDNVHAASDHHVQRIQESSEFFADVGVALAVAESLDGRLLILVEDMDDCQLLGPVGSIENEGLADVLRYSDFLDS